MEPNPSFFLRAIRREVLSDALLTTGVDSGSSNVIMQRAGEVLAQLILRHERLPEIVRKTFPEQILTLKAIAQRLRKNGDAVPASINSAIEQFGTLDSNPGGIEVELYELICQGQSDGIRALRNINNLTPEDIEFTCDICRIICDFEVRLRDDYSHQLEVIRGVEAQDAKQDSASPAPTEEQLTAYLRMRFPAESGMTARNVQRLVADNSKDIFFFDVDGSTEFDGSYVMRREPAFNITQATLVTEYELMRHLKSAGIPVPRVLVGEGDFSYFGGGFIVTERLSGTTRPASKLGPNTKSILNEIARISAKIHQVTIPNHLPQFADASKSTTDRMLAKVDAIYSRWINDRSEDSVIMESAYNWLRVNVRCLDDTAVLVHGDYSLRNVLLDGDRVSAILDWELCSVSHPAEDLAYMRPFIESVMPWEEYLAAYHMHTRFDITNAALSYFDVWAQFWQVGIAAAAYSGYSQNKHRNFIFASVACVEYRERSDRLANLIATL